MTYDVFDRTRFYFTLLGGSVVFSIGLKAVMLFTNWWLRRRRHHDESDST